MGTIIPIMGTTARTSARPPFDGAMGDALFTNVQQRVLGLLFGNADRSFYAKEIIHLAGSGSGAVQRELANSRSSRRLGWSRCGGWGIKRTIRPTPRRPSTKNSAR